MAGPYNAATDLIERNLEAGRANKPAFIDHGGPVSYGELASLVDRFAENLIHLGIEPEQRIFLCLLDTVHFPIAFLGAIKAGVVPVAASTMLTPADYDYMLRDSRARALFVSGPLLDRFEPLLENHSTLRHIVVSEGASHTPFDRMLDGDGPFEATPTSADEPCFWLYSSGSTGQPKGAVHLHSHLVKTAELYAQPVLGIHEDDLVYSAAKLFFAYGLGNGLTFPMSVGATSILYRDRPTPTAVSDVLINHSPTLFFGVPTLYGMMLADDDLPTREQLNLRLCVSAGEALPPELLRRWREHFGIDILDGIGSTEMLHIFISNRMGEAKPGASGKPVPGYTARIQDDDGDEVPAGEIGELLISGPTSAAYYWNKREKSRFTFLGHWTRTGDKYRVDEDGDYIYCGRTDDMLKVGGIYVSPFEVESALVTHPDVLEAAVVGKTDHDELVKPKAFVVRKPGGTASEGELIQHVRGALADFKRPRWVEFVDDLPKTATGKIQRYKLRNRERTS